MPTGSGDRWAEEYERGRPGWPAEVVEVAGVTPGATVLDLGAGTGKLTRVLVPAFRRVVALEPAGAMRRWLVKACPDAEVLAGTGQRLPLPDASVDAVFAAQAFHWFDDAGALGEIARVLRPGGALVVLWNLPAGPWEPSTAAAEQLLSARMPSGDLGYDPLDLGRPGYGAEVDQALAGTAFEPLRQARLANPQTLDRDGLVAFFASMGWLADLPDGVRLPLIDEMRSLLTADEYRRPWETHVRWTRFGSRRS